MSDRLCEVSVSELTEDRLGRTYVLLTDDEGRQLPIWIGRCEGFSISLQLEAAKIERPMTHDLLVNSIERLGGKLTRVLIDDLWQDYFYAKLCLTENDDGQEFQVDCRPADAIAVALRANVSIMVRDDVLEEGKL